MAKGKFLFRYLFFLGLALTLSFGIHSWVRGRAGLEALGDMLPYTYLFNLLLAFGVVAGLYMVRNKMRFQIGFLFIGGSLLKFLLFFLIFYPSFTLDQTIDRPEFFSFFTPYFLSLVLETYYASLLLKNLEDEHPG